ncbi:hypothetical protein BUALT_Bualt17G0019700 [Buddleja alternifolia]|uniref:Uncharacterized protein n=1 Tax=Buddleja alternifolia TaxID=168488 RepID=A0AAV6WD68_9LAMI|nr:hypothetical protein BUALT_Bualt17G0019700 [Buddleja alternifolia]
MEKLRRGENGDDGKMEQYVLEYGSVVLARRQHDGSTPYLTAAKLVEMGSSTWKLRHKEMGKKGAPQVLVPISHFPDPSFKNHREKKNLLGTARYASVNTHRGDGE